MSRRPEMRFVSHEAAQEQVLLADMLKEVDSTKDMDIDWLEPEPTRILALARAQLDEWVRGLRVAAGVDAGDQASPQVLARLVRHRAAILPPDDELDYILDAFDEAVLLREALQESVAVVHGTCYLVTTRQREHVITLGPSLPALEILGITGSDSGEFVDDPDSVFATAVTLTKDVCQLAATLRHHHRANGTDSASSAVPELGVASQLEPVPSEVPAVGQDSDAWLPDSGSQAKDAVDVAKDGVDVGATSKPRPRPYARRVADQGIWLRSGPSNHPDFPRANACFGSSTLYPGDPGWEHWDRELGEREAIEAEDPPF